MQQAVLGCSQLENSIPAPASCFPSRHSLDPQRARRSRAQEQAHSHRQRGGGRKAESRLSQQIAPSTSLPPCAVVPQQQGQMYWNKDGTGLPASLARDRRNRDMLLAVAAQGHTEQALLSGAVDFTQKSSNASPTLQPKCQTSKLLHSRVLSLFSSPSLCQHGRAVEIQLPFPGE